MFSHWQLYVELLKAKTATSIKVLIRQISNDECERSYIKNIVRIELLALTSSLKLYIENLSSIYYFLLCTFDFYFIYVYCSHIQECIIKLFHEK